MILVPYNAVFSGEVSLCVFFPVSETEMPEFVGIDALWIIHKVKPEKTEPLPSAGDTSNREHPVMLMSELYRDATYEFTENTGDGGISYNCYVDLADNRFEATGRTKKAAKLATATVAVEALTADGTLERRRAEVAKAREARQAKRAEIAERRKAIVEQRKAERQNREHKNPPTPKNAVMRLHDLGVRPKAYSLVAAGDGDGHSGFTVTVLARGQVYAGTGLSKRRAKLEAAENALKGMGEWTEEDDELKKEIVAKDEKKIANMMACVAASGDGKRKKKKAAKDGVAAAPQPMAEDVNLPDNYDASIYERKVPGTTQPLAPLAQPFGQTPGIKQEEGVKCEPGYAAADQKPC